MSQLVRVDEIFIDRILDDTHGLWHDALARPAYGRFWQAQLSTTWGREHLTRWALVDGSRVLSSAKLYQLQACLDGQPINIARIGAVFTPETMRGRGAARELIDRILGEPAAACDAALLFSEIGAEYYARLGFVDVPIDDLALRVIEDSRRGAPATLVRSGEDRDLPDIVAIDAARAEPFRFHLRRSRDLVQFAIAKKRLLAGLGPRGLREVQFFVAEEGASAVAYVVIEAKGNEWTIDSCGDRDPAGARVGAILQVLIARDPSQRRPRIKGWLPSAFRPPQLERLDATPSRELMMIKPLTDRVRARPGLDSRTVLYWRGDVF